MDKEEYNNIVYVAGDWRDPPLELVRKLKEAGWVIAQKWWEPQEHLDTWANRDRLQSKIEEAAVFILDLRSKREKTHPFAGSHFGAGMAYQLGKPIVALGERKTSLLADFVQNNDEAILEMLKKSNDAGQT